MPKKKKKAKKRAKFRVKGVPKGTFKLPIQTATLVPSTTKLSKKISRSAFQRRVAETRRFLSKLFGGYTSVRTTGGYVSAANRLIRENVVAVVAYAERSTYRKNKAKWLKWIKIKKKQWGQESMGIIIENDMFWM